MARTLERREYGQALQVARTVHPELLRAEQLASQILRHDLLIRETVAGLLRQPRRDAGVGSCAAWPRAGEPRRSGEPGRW